ncbi:structure-specific endonuclease subunit SLX4 [Malaya genurostris]|uniref:structure-specific endonuclease subunit SLX4 n=1 Tax=Malaya genurostris TaxID=325434 RepID=UPI0026F3EB6E|nr:structure-specific endonuclease subunit SLX4 [Malaya genurostris]
MLEHTVADRLDPEQFQLALAMSRSLVDQGGSQQSDSLASLDNAKASNSSSSVSSEERRIQGIRATLEQYGFKCKNSYQDYDLNVMFGNNTTAMKHSKKGKYRRPSFLVRRNREDLKAFMKAQCERLLKEELNQPLVESTNVNCDIRTYGSDTFWMNQNTEKCDSGMTDYYVDGLVEMNAVGAGYLLKSWSRIPGREWTPERCEKPSDPEPICEIDIQPVEFEGYELIENPEDSLLDMNTVPEEYRKEYNNEAPVYVRPERSHSPDLFASDSGGEADENPKPVESVEVRETPSDDDESDLGANKEENKISALMCTSSENIFDDCEPILDCDMYSSEEVKICTVGTSEACDKSNSPPGRTPTKTNAEMDVEQDHVILISSEENSNEKIEPTLTEALFPSPPKDLSFHALAIQDRLSRASINEMETIELQEDIDDAEDVTQDDDDDDRPSQSIEENNDKQQVSNHSKTSLHSIQNELDDEVLVISDDEVNYSMQQNDSLLYNVSPIASEASVGDVPPNSNGEQKVAAEPGLDLNVTTVYFNADEFKELKAIEGGCNENVCCISSDEENDKNSNGKSVAADNTMAFLDELIQKYNLPPSQPNCDKPNQSELTNYLDNYEIPDFPEETETERENKSVRSSPVSPKQFVPSEEIDREIEQILSQAKQTCTQRGPTEPRSKPIKRTISDSALLRQNKRKPPSVPLGAEKQDSFQTKFKQLTEEPEPPPAKYQIVLDGVSPRPDYDGMVSPALHRELFKYGLKQLSRPKAVKMLNHIYDQLHPLVEVYESEENDEVNSSQTTSDNNVSAVVKKIATTDASSQCNMDSFSAELPDEEYILPAKPRKKTFWCAVPLNIAFYNMVKFNQSLLRQILCYQPIDLDAIYGQLKEIGLRYETNDLIAFLDKRCITFRTAQGSGSRTKKSKTS